MKNKPSYLIIHHTGGSDANPLQDSSNQSFATVDAFHKQKFNMRSSLGYYIAYHYFIDKQGVVTQGRADTDEGAHTIGKNTSSLGICLAGNFDATLPTEAQKKSLTELLKRKMLEHSIPASKIVPHRNFAAKSCYGNKLGEDWARKLVEKPIVTNPFEAYKTVELINELKRRILESDL